MAEETATHYANGDEKAVLLPKLALSNECLRALGEEARRLGHPLSREEYADVISRFQAEAHTQISTMQRQVLLQEALNKQPQKIA